MKCYRGCYCPGIAIVSIAIVRLAIVEMLQGLLLSRPAFVACRLNDAMKGWGTEDDVLIRLLEP